MLTLLAPPLGIEPACPWGTGNFQSHVLFPKPGLKIIFGVFCIEPVGDLLGDQGGVAAGAVVDNEVHLDLLFYSLVHDFNGILDHFRTKCLASEEAIKPGQQHPGSHTEDSTTDLLSHPTSYDSPTLR